MAKDLSLPLELLHRLLPGAPLLPDAILAAAERSGLNYNFFTITAWPDLDARDAKTEMFDLVFGRKPMPVGEVVVVTDESFTSGNFIRCPSHELRQRVDQSSHFMFDGDIIFLWCEIEAVTVFHHEGGYAHIGW